MAADLDGRKRDYTEEEAREFWENARQRVKQGKCNFRNWCFPKDPDEKCFWGATFGGQADFERATFEGYARFRNATFKEDADFRHTTFKEDAGFQGATFKRNADFLYATFATFDGYASFERATFEGYANFHSAVFEGNADFRYATFKGSAKFLGTDFEKNADFRHAMLKAGADFRGATFSGDAAFWEAVFRGDADFQCAVFKGSAWFKGATAAKTMSFSLSWQKPRPFLRAEEGESAYRLAKQSAQDHGHYRAAGDYYYAEQCAINCRMRKNATWRPWSPAFWKHQSWRRTPLSFPEGEGDGLRAYGEFFFGRLLFGYGERPTRPLWAGGVVILLWSLVYWLGGIVDGVVVDPATKQELPNVVHGFWTALYFSVVTFTTLGYGDLQPPPGPMRLFAGTEAILGACLMALFIVCLARKFTR